MARRIAVDYLRARHAKEVIFVRLAYAIGHDQRSKHRRHRRHRRTNPLTENPKPADSKTAQSPATTSPRAASSNTSATSPYLRTIRPLHGHFWRSLGGINNPDYKSTPYGASLQTRRFKLTNVNNSQPLHSKNINLIAPCSFMSENLSKFAKTS